MHTNLTLSQDTIENLAVLVQKYMEANREVGTVQDALAQALCEHPAYVLLTDGDRKAIEFEALNKA